MRSWLLVAILLLALALRAAPSAPSAVAGGDDPRSLVEARYAQIKAIIAENADDHAMREKVKAVTLEFVDFDSFAAETIRSSWKELTDDQRGAFVDAFKRLIQVTYARHFKPRQDLTITYRTTTRYGDDKAQVATTLAFEKSQVDVDYRFVKKPDGRWWVYDLIIDEVSLMRNYRAQFRRILKADGFDALLVRIERAVVRKERGGDASDEL